MRLDYPTLSRTIETFQEHASGRTMEARPVGQMVQVNAERDHARQTVNLHVRSIADISDPYGAFAVPERIIWRAVQPGEEVPRGATLTLDERMARSLAEQLGEFHPEMRRYQRTREQLDQSQAELRSLSNQLEEVRNHNLTLVRTNQEQQRQCRWLERELRDANQERRDSD